jgi:signal peptidase I
MWLILSSLFLFLVASLATLRLCFLIVTIRGPSMIPALNPGERALILRYWPRKWLKQGDIVVISAQDLAITADLDFPEGLYIKRVVGLPGDSVTNYLDGSDISRRWQIVKYKYEENDRHEEIRLKDMVMGFIPSRHIFVCGDNTAASQDSRIWGPIPWQAVSGIVVKRMSLQVLRNRPQKTFE